MNLKPLEQVSFVTEMYILASDFFSRKRLLINNLKLEIRVVCRDFLHLNTYLSFFKTNQVITYICTSEILKTQV